MNIDEKISLKELTTMKTGGDARYFCVVRSKDDVRKAVKFAKDKNLDFFVLGGGSNLVISDSGFDGLVIKNSIKGIKFEDLNNDFVKVTSGAGENWDNFVFETVEDGLWGLENLSGIPGTVGASPVQNIGAYGSDVSSTIFSVEIFDPISMDFRVLSKEQCRFGYRDSIFKKGDSRKFIVINVSFKLSRKSVPNIDYKDLKEYFAGKTPNLREVRDAVLKIRSGKFPPLHKYGTAGSFFKNPIIGLSQLDTLKSKFPDVPSFSQGKNLFKVPLAWILDKVCGFKGLKTERVGLYEKQPLVLVNLGEATAHEIAVFAEKIKEEVKKHTGIEIEREVEYVGSDTLPNEYDSWFWKKLYLFWPRLVIFVQSFGIHKFKQNYLIGFLAEEKKPEEFAVFLQKHGYTKAYMAWKDPGEILSVRKIVRNIFQYHIRLFNDGEIRGHYEYTPEAKPFEHLFEKVFTFPKKYFEDLLHKFLKK
jgi:UDP-N-acetylmuramate dehydrogenase